MKTSQVTSRYHICSFFDAPTMIELRDFAKPVEVRTPFDWSSQFSIFKHGRPTTVIVCCGPAATAPAGFTHPPAVFAPAAPEHMRICGKLGPNDVVCELNPRHVTLPYRERQHAATTSKGLVKW